MDQPPLFDIDGGETSDTAVEPDRYSLHGEDRDAIGPLQEDVIAWTFEGGIWWMTGDDGSITGYNFEHFHWLSLRKQVI